jgi:hypothetical protein
VYIFLAIGRGCVNLVLLVLERQFVGLADANAGKLSEPAILQPVPVNFPRKDALTSRVQPYQKSSSASFRLVDQKLLL